MDYLRPWTVPIVVWPWAQPRACDRFPRPDRPAAPPRAGEERGDAIRKVDSSLDPNAPIRAEPGETQGDDGRS